MGWLLLVACFPVSLIAASQPGTVESPVGLPGHIEEVIIEGSELEAVPIESAEQPIVLRIVETFKHGTAHRYHLVFQGMEPGEYNLVDYLRRKDGSTTDNIPPITVRVVASLEPGQVQPHSLRSQRSPRPSNYRLWVAGVIAVWFLGLWLILAWRRPSGDGDEGGKGAKGPSFADQLRPLVTKAREGSISQGEAAQLERMLIHYWQRRLQLDDLPSAKILPTLREHEEAGPLLLQVEQWLHQPGPAANVDINQLLQPYEHVVDAPETGEPV